jgi:DUF4097 and DUF4098 domain-containing protein YvlB
MSEEKTIILNMLKEGKITVEEAQALLEAVEDEAGEDKRPETEKDKIKIDLDEMKAGLKSSFKDFGRTMEGTIRSVVEGFKSLDLGDVVSTAFGPAKESVEKEVILSAERLTGINLNTQSGDVTITGSDTGDVLIHAVVTARGSNAENAKQRAEEIDIIHEIEDETLLVKDSDVKMNVTGPYSVDYTVTVPRRFFVKLMTMSGDVAVRSTEETISINNYSGDIHCKDCSGSVKVNTKSGDVNIECFTGDLKLRTLSGDLTLSDIVSGSVSCNTLSGDIEGTLSPVAEAEISAKTLSGDIELGIDTNAELAITAESLSGDLSCSLPVSETEKKNRRFTATLNAATGNLNLSTKSGDIILTPLRKTEGSAE